MRRTRTYAITSTAFSPGLGHLQYRWVRDGYEENEEQCRRPNKMENGVSKMTIKLENGENILN